MLFVLSIGVIYTMYTVIRFCRNETVFLDVCLLYLYFPLDCSWQYLYICHNNITLISSEVSHDIKDYRDILLTWLCLMIFYVHDNHEVLYNSYRLKIRIGISPDRLLCTLWLWYLSFSDDGPVMLISSNE